MRIIEKDVLLEMIQHKSEREAGRLAGKFARAASEEKEAILAELELEQWVAQSCDVCLDRPQRC